MTPPTQASRACLSFGDLGQEWSSNATSLYMIVIKGSESPSDLDVLIIYKDRDDLMTHGKWACGK